MTISGSRRINRGRSALLSMVAVMCIGGAAIAAYFLIGNSTNNSSTMRTWTYGDFTMEVPANWTSATINPGGSSDFFTFTNGTGDEYADVEFNRCSGCNATTNISSGLQVGAPDLANYIPPSALDVKYVNPWEATYKTSQPPTLFNGSTPAPTPGHLYEGLVIDDHQLFFSLTIQIAVRTSDTSLAQQIFSSVHQSSTPS